MVSPISLQCDALLFDLDGVLVDSSACVEHTWRTWAARHHMDADRVIAVAHGRRTIETIRLVAPNLSAESEVAALEGIESNTTEGVFEVPGARALLQSLPRGRWAIVTSGTGPVAKLRIKHTQLPQPQVLVCADEIRRGKPDPEGYLTATKRLGVDPAACVIIEDTPLGLEAARAAGIRSIAVCGTYNPDALTMADYTIPNLAALRVTAGNGDAPLELHLTHA